MYIKEKNRRTAMRLGWATAGLLAFGYSNSDGATYYWTGGSVGTNQEWSSTGNWATPTDGPGIYQSTTSLPTSGGNVVQIDTTENSGTVKEFLGLNANFTINSLVLGGSITTPIQYLDDSATTSNTTVYTLTLNGDGSSSDDLINLTNSAASEFDLRGYENLTSGTGNVIVMLLNIGGAGNFDPVNSNNYIKIDPNITSTATTLGKVGSGTLVLAGTNTFAAGSTFNTGSGTTTFTGSNTFTTTTGSTFNVNGGSFTNSGTVTFGASSALNVTAGTAVNSGTLILGNNSTVAASGGTLVESGTLSLGTGAALNVSNGSTVNLSGSTNTFGTASNININSGTLVATSSTQLGSAGNASINIGAGTFSWQSTTAVALNSARLFTLNSTSSTIDVISGGSLSIPSAITGGGDLTKTSAGTLVIENSGNSFSGGAVNVNGGVLVINNPSDLGANATAAAPTAININAGTLEFAGLNYNIANNLPISMNSASSAIDVIGGSSLTITNTINYTNSISGSGVLNKVDSGDLVVNVPTSVTAINVAGGTLTIGNASALGTVPSTASTDVTLGSSTTLDFTVGLALNSKRLVVIGPSVGSGNSTIEVDNGTISTNYTTIPGAISNNGSGTGGLYKTGTGDLFLNGVNTYSGPTNINLGLLAGNGSLQSVVNVNSGGAVSAGSTAVVNSVTTLTIGALTSTGQVWNGGGAYAWKLDLSNPGTPGATTNSGTAGTNWDNLSMGTLSIAANSASTFTIHLIGINAGASTFDPTQNYIWNIANTTASGGSANITGFGPSDFVLDTSSFGVATNGNFSIGEVPDGQGEDLSISYTPTPEPAVSFVAVLASALMLRRRRRSATTAGHAPMI